MAVEGKPKRPRRQKCIGLMGRLFGHRFTVNVGDVAYKTDYCGRCGMPAGQDTGKAEDDG